MLNQQVLIQYPNGKQALFSKGVKLIDVAKVLSPSLAKKALVGSLNATTYDLAKPILTDAEITICDAHFGVGPIIVLSEWYKFLL